MAGDERRTLLVSLALSDLPRTPLAESLLPPDA